MPAYGWGPKGRRVPGQIPTGHRRHHTLIGVLTPTGMGPPFLIEGGVDRTVFDTFLAEQLVPLLRPGQLVIMDNASIHKGTRTRELIEATGAQLRFLPPASPEFNPIESAFAKLKQGLRNARPRTPEALASAIKEGLAAITQRDVAGFYRGAGYELAS